MSPANSFRLGKYKGIILSIALFLILDASVLLINFYISFEISADAEAVNIAGRQRMLSQRMMKSLLNAKVSMDRPNESLDELKRTTALFDDTLTAFNRGGETRNTSGETIYLQPVSSARGQRAVVDAINIWQPYSATINQLLFKHKQSESDNFPEQLEEAISIGQISNLKLLTLMNNLTQDLENYASSKATKLRVIQTVGISLALINFFIIMFHFLRQLNESDKKIEKARKETHEILATVNSGLFLIDSSLSISNQHSSQLEKIFGRSNFHKETLDSLLTDLVSSKDLSTTRNFVKLLFKPAIKEKLITDLNPLSKTEIRIQNTKGSYDSKYLNFSFSRVTETEKITHILVTVTDITREVQLSKQLDKEKSKNEKQLELLSSLLSVDAKILPIFLQNCLNEFSGINHILKEKYRGLGTHQLKIEKIFHIIHNVKGESSALRLTRFEDMSHEFEDELQSLKSEANLEGKHFLHLTVLLNNFISEVEASIQLAAKLNKFVNSDASNSDLASADMESSDPGSTISRNLYWSDFTTLARSTSIRQGKKLEFTHSGLNDRDLPNNLVQTINKISIQLIRNSIVHGIERPDKRKISKKSEFGDISMRLVQKTDGSIQYTFQDDGAGINTEEVRKQAIKLNIISAQESQNMGRKQLINLIFSPEFSSLDMSSTDGGRGVGMNLVRTLVKKMNATLTISTKVSVGTKFVITFPKPVLQLTQVA